MNFWTGPSGYGKNIQIVDNILGSAGIGASPSGIGVGAIPGMSAYKGILFNQQEVMDASTNARFYTNFNNEPVGNDNTGGGHATGGLDCILIARNRISACDHNAIVFQSIMARFSNAVQMYGNVTYGNNVGNYPAGTVVDLYAQYVDNFDHAQNQIGPVAPGSSGTPGTYFDPANTPPGSHGWASA